MNIIKNRNIYRMISAAIIIVGLIMFMVSGLNYGIDFTGGTILQIKIGKFISVEEAKELVDEFDKDATVIHVGNDKDEIIIKSTLDLSNNETTALINKFVEKYDIEGDNFQTEKVGPSMGAEIKKKALTSMLIATVLMLAYITWRFEFTFGISAIIALVHDILIMLSFYSIFKIPVDNAFIAAILTIVGYSINDTIVIFDRIRENVKLYPRESPEEIVNKSISQSLKRTINTSITTLIAVLVVYILGVENMKILALPLMVGIIAGSYSSIFIASPIWYDLKNKKTIKTAK